MLLKPACFLGAVQLLAKKQGKEEMAKAAQIVANVSLGESAEKPGFGLTVDIQAVGIDEALAQAAHEVRICTVFLPNPRPHFLLSFALSVAP